MATNIPQDNFQKTALRLPKELHARLHEAATKTGRSYNAEIIARLEASFAEPVTADMKNFLQSLMHEAMVGVIKETREDPAAALAALERIEKRTK